MTTPINLKTIVGAGVVSLDSSWAEVTGIAFDGTGCLSQQSSGTPEARAISERNSWEGFITYLVEVHLHTYLSLSKMARRYSNSFVVELDSSLK